MTVQGLVELPRHNESALLQAVAHTVSMLCYHDARLHHLVMLSETVCSAASGSSSEAGRLWCRCCMHAVAQL